MLRSVICNVLSVYFNIIILQYLIVFSLNYCKVRAALPPGAEDEIVLIEHLPGRQVHLQDFFWTGAEDAPSWLDPDQAINFYETRTVHHTATVYVTNEDNGKNSDTNSGDARGPGCISCIEPTPTLIDPDQDIGILVGNDPGPRYWLLTVLRAGESVPSKVELRLARLYRAAFSRHQQRHLGLLSTDARPRRDNKQRSSLDGYKSLAELSDKDYVKHSMKNLSATDSTTLVSVLIKKSELNVEEQSTDQLPGTSISQKNFNYTNGDIKDLQVNSTMSIVALNLNSRQINETSMKNKEMTFFNISDNKNTIEPQSLRKNSEVHLDFTLDKSKQLKFVNMKSPNIFIHDKTFNNIIRNKSGNRSEDTSRRYMFNNLINQTEINSTSSKLRAARIEMVQVRMQNTTVLNDGSTQLIYSVHLGGKPVPAETAAKDMALLSPQEVALELGAPVIIQSEPYLKESHPLALSKHRDAWLLLGAGGAGLTFLIIIIASLVITAKRKRAHSSVSAPPTQSILKREREYTSTTSGLDNTGYTSETEGPTDGISQGQTPQSLSRTILITSNTPATMDDKIQELSSDSDEEQVKKNPDQTWDIEDFSNIKADTRKSKRINSVNMPGSPDSIDTGAGFHEQRKAIDNGCIYTLDETASLHSYLSMPSCKLFPSMRTVEPLSKILEPVVIQHLDMEFETPEMSRRQNGFAQEKPLEIKPVARTRSALKDPGVVGPIVWDLRKQRAVEGSAALGEDFERQLPSSGPVGRARRRLHELLEDSFNLFSAKDVKVKENVISSPLCPSSATILSDHVMTLSDSKATSEQSSPNKSPKNHLKIRPRTSLFRNSLEETTPKTENTVRTSRSTWDTRPMSAGPFHRPNLPEVNVTRIHVDSHLSLDDPAVPLIAAIKKELGKFTPDISQT